MGAKSITLKQKRFAAEYVKTGNATASAMAAYDTKKRRNAKQIGHRMVRNENVQQEIKAILIKAGLSLDQAADYLRKIIVKGLEGKANASDSLRGLDMLFKLNNSYPASRSIKLSYSRRELVASKDLQQTVDELKRITERSNSLIASTD